MKIIAGSLQHETNGFSPVKTNVRDFDIVKGRAMLNRIAPTSFFREAGIDIIPTLYANALPSGKMEERSFLELRNGILNICQRVDKIDGVWLYLHGAMEVENIVVKLGYLWDKLRRISDKTIIALTPGASCESVERMQFCNIKRQIYPIDKDFKWSPE